MNNRKRLISVVIPTFNREDLIKDAINTVLEQVYQNFEIIIIDDGSTDNTSEVVKSFDDARIKYIYQENAGISKARNKGIEDASGEYIAFLDSDDLWHPEKLEKQVSVLDKDPDVDLLSNNSQYMTFQNDIIEIKKNYVKSQKENISLILLDPDKVFTGTPTLLVRKTIFEKVGLFDETVTFCEDWDLFFRIALVGKICHIPEILTYVRNHKGNITNISHVGKFKNGYLRFLEKAFSNELLPLEMLQIKKQVYSNTWWSIAYWALYKSQDYTVARESLWKSLKKSPRKIFNIGFLIALFLSYSPVIFLEKYKKIKKI